MLKKHLRRKGVKMNKVNDNVMELDLNTLKPKKHIFISGSIGIGKTTVINNLKSQLKDNYGFVDELLGDDLIALSYDENVHPQRSIELNLELKKFHQVIFNEYKGKLQTYIYDRGIVDPITFGAIFNKFDNGIIFFHCYLCADFTQGGYIPMGDVELIYPWQKEHHQRFFQKMREAGYNWDANKKELKEI